VDSGKESPRFSAGEYVKTTYTATSTLAIGLSSGYIVRLVEDSATTVRETSGKRSATPGGWFTLATHSEMRHI